MSGIITGPHFKEYFNKPDAGELGLMVSVLEIGALSTLSKIRWQSSDPPLIFHSNFACRRSHWRLDRPQGHPVHWCGSFHRWRGNPNLHWGYPQHGLWEVYLRVWRWIVVVSLCPVVPHRRITSVSRTIVPIYQSEISPPNHVGIPALLTSSFPDPGV